MHIVRAHHEANVYNPYGNKIISSINQLKKQILRGIYQEAKVGFPTST